MTEIATIKNTMVEAVSLMERADISSKSLFNQSLKYLKSVSNLTDGEKALTGLADTLETTKHYQKRIKMIVHYAKIATDTKLFIDADSLLWYNVEKALKLMEHLAEHYSDDVSKVKNKLNKLRPKGINVATPAEQRKYNEAYTMELVELYKQYKLEDDEEQKGVKIEKVFESLSAESQAGLIAKLLKAQKKIEEVA